MGLKSLLTVRETDQVDPIRSLIYCYHGRQRTPQPRGHVWALQRVCLNPTAAGCVRRWLRPPATAPDTISLGPQDDLGLCRSLSLSLLIREMGELRPLVIPSSNQSFLQGKLPSAGPGGDGGPPPAHRGCLGNEHQEARQLRLCPPVPFGVPRDTSQPPRSSAVARAA